MNRRDFLTNSTFAASGLMFAENSMRLIPANLSANVRQLTNANSPQKPFKPRLPK
jgi:hypothetical protein